MTNEIDHTFRGARFIGDDFTGATFRDCDLRQVKIVGSMIADLHVSGFAGEIENVVVNDVDVTAFVVAELDRRQPERVQLRAVRTADDYREMWSAIERLWSDTIARAQLLPDQLGRNGSTTSGPWSRPCVISSSLQMSGPVEWFSVSRCPTTDWVCRPRTTPVAKRRRSVSSSSPSRRSQR